VLLDVGKNRLSKRGFLDRNMLEAIDLAGEADDDIQSNANEFAHALREQLLVSEAQYNLGRLDLGALGINGKRSINHAYRRRINSGMLVSM
jgi:hypothetical protein